jgi:hypothetical protein
MYKTLRVIRILIALGILQLVFQLALFGPLASSAEESNRKAFIQLVIMLAVGIAAFAAVQLGMQKLSPQTAQTAKSVKILAAGTGLAAMLGLGCLVLLIIVIVVLLFRG